VTNTRKPRRSKAHDFSALSTSVGVALTLALCGALVAGALLVQDLKADWMSSMRVELVLLEPPSDGGSVEQWVQRVQADDAVTQVVYVDPDSAARELESELGEPFMDFLGASPLPAVLELALSPQWMGELGLAGLIEKEAEWQNMDGVARVEYPRALLAQLDRGFQDWTLPGLSLVAVLMAIVVAQIMNVVRLSVFGRRFLIRSMELVGAPPHRIRRPFIAEAMGYGAVGALLAYAGLVAALVGARSFLPEAMATWGARELGIIWVSQMALGLVLTGLSARWAVSRYFGARLDKLM
jgi:cell division transport system permease protein